jgi:N-acyl homoserine lactone hydrolase
MKVYFMYTGSMHCDYRWIVAGSNFATRTDHSPPSVWYDCPTLTVLIDHPDGRILFDTSCPRDWEQRWAPTGVSEIFPWDTVSEEQHLDRCLAALGVKPSDLDAVVLSHLHFDHAGNAATFAQAGVKLLAHPAELAGVASIEAPGVGGYLTADFAGLEIEPVDVSRELLPGVRLLWLPGHSWGTMGVLFDLPDTGPLLYTCDAVHCREQYGPPAAGPGFAWSTPDWFESVEKVRRLAHETGALVVFGHDSEMIHNELRLAPEYYS